MSEFLQDVQLKRCSNIALFLSVPQWYIYRNSRIKFSISLSYSELVLTLIILRRLTIKKNFQKKKSFNNYFFI